MKKMYQIFVSSTFTDLIDERQVVMLSLLRLGCIPTGMEFRPASNEDTWKIIKAMIDQTDYYIVIIAGRYGRITKEGISYTQREYEYARSKGVPVLAFLHKQPDSISYGKSEINTDTRRLLQSFRKTCEEQYCSYWQNAEELAREVVTSLTRAFQETPRLGWIRGSDSGNGTLHYARNVNVERGTLADRENGVVTSETTTSELIDVMNEECEIIYDVRGELVYGPNRSKRKGYSWKSVVK